MSLQASAVCSTMAQSMLPHRQTQTPPVLALGLKAQHAATWRAKNPRGFCFSGFALDDLGQADTPHKAPGGSMGLGVTESPGGCAARRARDSHHRRRCECSRRSGRAPVGLGDSPPGAAVWCAGCRATLGAGQPICPGQRRHGF